MIFEELVISTVSEWLPKTPRIIVTSLQVISHILRKAIWNETCRVLILRLFLRFWMKILAPNIYFKIHAESI